MGAFADRFRVRVHADWMTEEEKRRIHEATLDVMARIGVRVDSAQGRKDLRAAGAVVDDKSRTVRFPADVVEGLLGEAPRRFTLAGRSDEYDLPMDGSHNYYTTDSCGVSVWEAAEGTRRKSVLEDVRRTALISDWLPYLSVYSPMVVPFDVPERSHVVNGVRVSMETTAKHIMSESTSNAEEARAQVRMAAAVVGSLEELRERHYLSAVLCTVSPLVLDGNASDAALAFSEGRAPIHIMSMAHAGMSGPATLAGDLVVSHAETLAAACMIEAHEPGAPILYGSILGSMDPRTGAYLGGGPETALLCGACAELARYCRLPVSAGAFGTSAKTPGLQATLENAMSALSCALVGGEVVAGIGEPDGSTLLSYEQLLLDHEIARSVVTMCKGFDVNRETLAEDLIEKVGVGGTYLAHAHTLKHLREAFLPMLWDSDPFDIWVQKGRKDPMAIAREKVEWILKHHEPPRLDGSTSAALGRIVKEFV
ncbi:MAG TPA: trimethylamine methyltransferase family protein [Thermoplasmata archaeon]